MHQSREFHRRSRERLVTEQGPPRGRLGLSGISSGAHGAVDDESDVDEAD
jgi:hypothetical protein